MVMMANKGSGYGLALRLLDVSEYSVYLDHLLRLDSQARWLRFDHAVDDAAIQAHCLHLMTRNARVLGAFLDGTLRGAAELDPSPGPNFPGIELAFSVERPFQRRGIGSMLLAMAMEIVSPEPAIMLCREKNRGMAALALHFGARVVQQGSDMLFVIETADHSARNMLKPVATADDIALHALIKGYV